MTRQSCIVAKQHSSFWGNSPENELHETQYGDLLSELVHILCQGRLVVQHRLVLAAQLIILVQVASMETFQHLLQPPVVLGCVQDFYLQAA